MALRTEINNESGSAGSEAAAISGAQASLDKAIKDIAGLIWLQHGFSGSPGAWPTAANGLEVTFRPYRADMPAVLRDALASSALASNSAFWQSWALAQSEQERRAALYLALRVPGVLTSFVVDTDTASQWQLWHTSALKVTISGSGGSWSWTVRLFCVRDGGEDE